MQVKIVASASCRYSEKKNPRDKQTEHKCIEVGLLYKCEEIAYQNVQSWRIDQGIHKTLVGIIMEHRNVWNVIWF